MNQNDLSVAIEAIAAIGKMIKEAKHLPSGHLYAQLANVLSLDKYEQVINLLKKTGLITERFNELIWIGD